MKVLTIREPFATLIKDKVKIYETNKMYDYREFDLKKNNIMVKKTYPLIKEGYENIE